MTRLPPDQRPSAAELAAQSSGVDPWACPRCGCKGPHPVENTYDTVSGGLFPRKRRRICRNCGQGLTKSWEVVVPEGHELRVVPKDSKAYAA